MGWEEPNISQWDRPARNSIVQVQKNLNLRACPKVLMS